MSSRTLEQRLQDILSQAEEILQFTRGMNFSDFAGDAKTVKAVLYDLAVIGEAARSLLPDILDVYPDVPWEDMRSLRNFTVHEYFRVNLKIIWATIQEDLPPLIEQIRELIAKIEIG
ncbi:HepT-like ribonuclease domain-containing protein [Pseudanabaena sp. Chao 1811]|uniref:HepT-like ribonuclease domain-containing protein n=1 Tax=Pseudanabaena sp. Chao 1811 TaxID=2963092 RepID=UPI0022F386BC|nr:DUF86 domain-containing protein [Pseudanabaena sp. Chao 1811]